MIAIPVAQRGENSLKNINLFTKAKLIALIADDGQQQVYENTFTSGKDLAEDLLQRGVKTLITNHMGANPYAILSAAGVEIVYRDGSLEIDALLELYRNNQLSKFDPSMVHAQSHDHSQADGKGQGHCKSGGGCGCH